MMLNCPVSSHWKFNVRGLSFDGGCSHLMSPNRGQVCDILTSDRCLCLKGK